MRHIKNRFPKDSFPNLLVGMDVLDDAAVWKVSKDLAIILTLDFFTPVVDDPYQYGAIAAANALSDVYAMGGDVALALNICGFPPSLPTEVTAEILRGGADTVIRAGGVIAGGHTVDDDEPKYGLVVMGTVHPDRVLTNAGAQPGDVLFLTKPLGVGIITTVLKAGEAKPSHVTGAVDAMLTLNKDAADIFREGIVHGLTDVTGYALLGHGMEMAENSGVRLRFFSDRIPFLPGAEEYADMWLFPGGTCNNERTFQDRITFDDDIPDETRQLLYTPETSGGLLAAAPPGRKDEILNRARERGVDIWEVGEVLSGSGIEVVKKR